MNISVYRVDDMMHHGLKEEVIHLWEWYLEHQKPSVDALNTGDGSVQTTTGVWQSIGTVVFIILNVLLGTCLTSLFSLS